MEQTIAAISTAVQEAGIGIVRVSGEKAIEIVKEIFKTKNKIEDKKMLYGHIYDNGKVIDEVMVSFMRGPKTYTREDMVEIYTHGSIMSVKLVLDLLLSKGARLAEKGEFTKRAFLNGRIDLSQAEAVIDIIKSKDEASYRQSISQLEGSVKKEIIKLRSMVMSQLASLEAYINFSEDDEGVYDEKPIIDNIKTIIDKIDKLIKTANRGKIIRDGISTIIIGKPNVGKSSLLNNLLKEERAIVTDIPGTTRDIIEESLSLGEVRINIIDTAGIRNTDDVVEKIGVEKSIKLSEQADLILALFDKSNEMDEEDFRVLDLIKNKKVIVLLNKSDLGNKIDEDKLKKEFPNLKIITSSMYMKQGIDELESAIKELFYLGDIKNSDQTIISNSRQEDCLKKAKKSLEDVILALESGISPDLLEVDLRDAWIRLGEITGEANDMEKVLDEIFSNFCIGK